jgi:hypothetical protein
MEVAMPSIDTVFQFVTAILLAYVAFKSRSTHLLVNSRMNELLAVTKELATKTGIAEGRTQVHEEQKKQ